VAAYPTAPAIAIPLDHVTIRRPRVAARWVGGYPQVRLILAPRSCPHHPVERIRGATMIYLANPPVETMAGRVRQVQAFFGGGVRSGGCGEPRRSGRPGCPRERAEVVGGRLARPSPGAAR